MGLMWGDLSVLTAGLVRLSGEVRGLLAGRGESHPEELRARAEVEEGAGRCRSRAVHTHTHTHTHTHNCQNGCLFAAE